MPKRAVRLGDHHAHRDHHANGDGHTNGDNHADSNRDQHAHGDVDKHVYGDDNCQHDAGYDNQHLERARWHERGAGSHDQPERHTDGYVH